ncbi:SseB family protein [Pauljensenia sp. 20925_1_27]
MTPTPPSLTEEQKNRLAQRLSMMSHDRADVGQGLPRTTRALALGRGNDAGAAQLEALVDALVFERVIVPIDVEPDPRVTGIHAGENGHNPIDFVRAQTPAGEALAIYSSADALSAHRPGDRPMALDFRTIGLTALVETGGRIVVNPGTDAVLLPRPAVAALAQGDEWLPAWRDEALRELLLAEASAACRAIVDLGIVYAGDGLTRVVVSVDRARFARGEEASSMKAELSAALNAVGTNPRLIASADRVEIAPVLR